MAAALIAHWRGQSHAIAAPFEISRLAPAQQRRLPRLLAVHEAGHGLVHALLFGRAPQEIKIHVASFEGGYNAYSSRKVWSRRNLRRLDLHQPRRPRRRAARLRARAQLQAALRAICARPPKPAPACCATSATAARIGRSDVSTDSDDNLCTDVEASNAPIEALLQPSTHAPRG
jgi:cell division protease FtsH